MIPELGHFSLILALALGILMAILPLTGAYRGVVTWIAFARPAAVAQFVLIAFSYLCLTWAFLDNDFSVKYVATHSNTHLPLIYKISGVWGGHEGSLLLWILILSGWTAAVAFFSRSLPASLSSRVIAVMGLIGIGFLLFTLLTSNPFLRLFPAPAEGRDLNPLLQDFGLAVHPPMLYLGYVGFSVPFAFSIAALLGGRFDSAWARWTRPWANFAWMFLTIGIALGSWWAYYELGWGGWWFWDPVENASFMPWLVGTALIHSLAATEKRGVFKAWTVLLAVLAFSLSLLGTFLVRSGVLISVHAFATDPTRGLFILIFLGVVTGSSLLLYAYRTSTIVSRIRFYPVSREMLILVNNILFGILCFSVLLGTLYPLIFDALNLGKISVGPPYFDFIFTWLGFPLLIAAGAGALLRWKKDQFSRIRNRLLTIGIVSVVFGLTIPILMPFYSVGTAAGITGGTLVILLSLSVILDRTHRGERIQRLRSTPRSIYGMIIAHAGLGVFIIGVVMTTVYSVEKDIRMQTGDTYEIGSYRFVFDSVVNRKGPNYDSVTGLFDVYRSGRFISRLEPEKRVYLIQQNPMTEAAIDPGFTRDLYIALGEPLENSQTWAVRIYLKPFVRWIWLGALMMALGGLLGATDKRYRAPATTRNLETARHPA
ncbi:MAG: heme lyase CcmF/NrfE family subunit [Gammaproteobacteria bacterium]|nr:heme lyase CcmF/NrfE family subunit [Gammaproteobacteria bacterium]